MVCFMSGLLQLLTAPFVRVIYSYIPRVALMSGLAGLGLVFLSLRFSIYVFAQPTFALLPLTIMFLTYASSVRPPFGIPGSLIAILLGTTVAWLLRWTDPNAQVRPCVLLVVVY